MYKGLLGQRSEDTYETHSDATCWQIKSGVAIGMT